MAKKHKSAKQGQRQKRQRSAWFWAAALIAGIAGLYGVFIWGPGSGGNRGAPAEAFSPGPQNEAQVIFNPFATKESLINHGEQLFAKNCAVCHGEGAPGEDPESPMGGKKPDGDWLAPALNGMGHAWHHPPQQLISMIAEGSPRPGSRMQGWKGQLNQHDINSVLGYLFSIWPETVQARYLYRPHH